MDLHCWIKDIPGAEGPCVSRDGRVFMVGPDQGRVLEVWPDGKFKDLANTGGIPAGLQFDRSNDLWVADMKLGILRINLQGKIFPEVTTFAGEPIRGCNDCYFDSRGNLYFSAPGGSSAEKPVGEVYCRLANGTVRRLDQGYAFSNGLAVSADDRLLVVAETFTKRLYAFDLPEPGVVTNKRHWGTLPGTHFGGPDGMDFDQKGRLLVTHWGGGAVEVFGADGTWLYGIKMPFDKVSNVHFFGPDNKSLLITEHTQHGLWESTHDTPGQVQFGMG